MSDIVIVETSNETNIIAIEADPGNIITLEDQTVINIELVNVEKILASDLPDDIPFTKIKKSGVDGVDYYLDNNYFYELDCGSP